MEILPWDGVAERKAGFVVQNIFKTRTAGAASPLVLESGGSVFFVLFFVFLYFTTPIFVPIRQFFNFTTIFTTNVYHIFYHKFYHKLLPQTTIIIEVSISTTTQMFVPIQQFFNFTTKFYHTFFTTYYNHIFYHKFYHKLLPQTTIIIGESIFTTTPIFVPIWQFFNFTTQFYHTCYHKFYHKPLP